MLCLSRRPYALLEAWTEDWIHPPGMQVRILPREKAGDGCRLPIATLIFASSQATLHHMDWKNRITIDPEKRGGKPCIRGLRMTVYDVLEYLASGMSEEDILKDFPDLTREDIRACLAFAADRERKLVSIPPS
jgi:uncharacterized protein (DUF433 family)